MAELFDLSHTLRRERELSTSTSTGSAAVAGSIDPTNNRDTNWIGKGVDTNKQVDLCLNYHILCFFNYFNNTSHTF